MSCRKMMEFASESLETQSGWWPRLRMHLHCRCCPPCGTLSKNFAILREAAKRAAKAGMTEAAAALQDIEGLSPEAKAKLAAYVAEESQATVETQKVVTDPAPVQTPAAEGTV